MRMHFAQKTKLFPENEIDRSEEAERSIEKIPVERFFHEPDRKDREDDHRDHFLENLQLGKSEVMVSNSVGRNLKAILKKGHRPARENGNPQRLSPKGFQVTVPGVRHENVRQEKKADGL